MEPITDFTNVPDALKERALRILNLLIERDQTLERKKAAAAAFKEDLDRINDEIEELMDDNDQIAEDEEEAADGQ